jgi:hypothetical protein
MNRKRAFELILAILLVALFIVAATVLSSGTRILDVVERLGKSSAVAPARQPSQSTPAPAAEQAVVPVELAGPLADPSAQVSGLAWYGDFLILLPQYPDVLSDGGDGFLFYLPKDEILAYIDGRSTAPLEPRPIQLIAPNLREQIPRYQGFESIGFSGDRVFLTIESGYRQMMGYLISGTIQPDLSALALDTARVAEIPPQADSSNRADEAILVLEDRVITFYEANGYVLNPNPVAHVFSPDLEPLGTLPMPNIEYRITDAAWTEDNQFWAINYFFVGDMALFPSNDPIVDAFGEGPTHAQKIQVERLLKFQYSDSGIALVDTPPVQLVLNDEIRNWEGLALLDDRGFLLATDKYPTTLLAFLPRPK